jgi:hypothetical protein
MIHLVNGDVVGEKLGSLEGEVLVWREMYDFGPLQFDMNDEIVSARAQYLEEKLGISASLFLENCEKQMETLKLVPRSTEVTLWFEHDRYDQTMLIYLLNELSKKGFENISMVSINQYPGVEPFYGLGQLTSEQLAGLFHQQKQQVTKEQINEAISAWRAYTSKNPQELEQWLMKTEEHLPFLKQALQTHLRYFPSKKNGLNEVEYLALDFINAHNCSFPKVFQYITEQRINDGLSDLHFAAMLNQLMEGDFPLLMSDGDMPSFTAPNPKATITVTSFGLDVLEGESDRFEHIEIDWWLGGVHLLEDQWRWDKTGLEKK